MRYSERVKLAVIGLVAACGSSQSVPVARGYPGTPWAKLIEPGAEWSLPIVDSSGSFAAGAAVRRDKGTVHCSTGSVERVGEAVVAHLTCDKPHDALSISGQWVQQPNGLYHPLIPITSVDDLAALLDDDLLLQAPPDERDSTHSTDSSVHRVEALRGDGDAWCVSDKTSAAGLQPGEPGERRAFILCMSPTRGIVSASELETHPDKTWHEIQLGDHPMLDPEDPLESARD